MSDYVISRVSSKEPREWSFTDNKGVKVSMESYKVMLEGEDEAVELNKKAGIKPAVGEQLTGTLLPSQYGLKFKPSPKPFTPGQGKDSAEIKAEWAIGQAVSYHTKDDISLEGIEQTATSLFHMVERVKTSTTQAAGRLTEKFNEWRAAKSTAAVTETATTQEEVFDVDDDKPINLDDIPF